MNILQCMNCFFFSYHQYSLYTFFCNSIENNNKWLQNHNEATTSKEREKKASLKEKRLSKRTARTYFSTANKDDNQAKTKLSTTL